MLDKKWFYIESKISNIILEAPEILTYVLMAFMIAYTLFVDYSGLYLNTFKN